MNASQATRSIRQARRDQPDTWTDQLPNGASVRIRPLRPHGLWAHADFFNRLSPRSRRNRFLGGINPRAGRELSQLCENDPGRGMAFVATLEPEGPEIGACRYAFEDEPDRAEFAIVVADHWQRKGLGTRLMMHLIDHAGRRGVNELHSHDWADNEAMRGLAREFGFQESVDPDDDALVVYRLDLILST